MNENVEETFGFAEMQVVSFEDLFGSKLHAAVDRQHPRDLFDVKLLYQNEGLTDALFRTFLIYVASSGAPARNGQAFARGTRRGLCGGVRRDDSRARQPQ